MVKGAEKGDDGYSSMKNVDFPMDGMNLRAPNRVFVSGLLLEMFHEDSVALPG